MPAVFRLRCGDGRRDRIEVAGGDRKGGDGGGSGAGRGRVGVDRLPWGQIRVYPVAERDEANFE